MTSTAWFVALFVMAGLPAFSATQLATVRVASGLVRPIWVTHAPADTARIFVIEKQGRIRILKNNTLLATAFLNIDPIVGGGTTDASEQGLLGLAFDPGYASNGYFYVHYTDNSGNIVIARYHVSADSDVADSSSALILLTVPHPVNTNHNGGWIAFGPDGYLYIATGDGGSGNDPPGNAQNTTVLLGKLLRIDPSGDGFPADPSRNYKIPPTNPFAAPGDPGADEIWDYGLRNPWRDSFDRLTGDLWIGDVGQSAREEVDFEPAGSGGGRNYGWRCMEGFTCTGLTGCTCNSAALTLPILDYDHGSGCAITGGYVYRGAAIPDLQGTYFYADYCSARIWSLRYSGSIADFTERTSELAPGFGLSIGSIPSFGEDAAGELYICDQNDGEIYKIVPATPGGAKSGPNGAPYTVKNTIVTAAFPDFFYMELPDRSSGIRVARTAHGLSVGAIVAVTGVLGTTPNGEKYLDASARAPTTSGAGSISPLDMNNLWLGGTDWLYDTSTGAGQRGVASGVGLNNIGLLVRSWGKVTPIDPQTFMINDGSDVPVKCILPAGVTFDPGWTYVAATGAMSCENVAGQLQRVILVRQSSDVSTH
ncbi:MAG: PQQ-dependent sugar dehydrogenase [Armatimonadetes bacterium]|nr:PQQ-dependent sugar dehydrogenase [Armatimonadota bacterium]